MSSLRKMSRMAVILALVVGLPLFIGCSNDDNNNNTTEPPPQETMGSITGVVTLPPGVNGDLTNARVACYASYDDWNNDRVLKSVGATGSASQVTFTITSLAPGTYYVDLWKDMDNDGTWSAGDLIGVHGTIQWPNLTVAPLSVIAGQTAVAQIIIFAIP